MQRLEELVDCTDDDNNNHRDSLDKEKRIVFKIAFVGLIAFLRDSHQK
jgi:hypothetical protein